MKFSILHHADQKSIDEMYHGYEPVFILSTGRSGSRFIAEMLAESFNLASFHEPQPALEYFSNYAYHHQNEFELLTKMVDAARMELILDIFIKDKIYVESNQCLTFFAPMLSRLFKKSRFVHIVRHPGDFIRSAVRKGWHKNDTIWESGRVQMEDKHQWNRLDHLQKLAWVWAVTNRFLEDFRGTVEKDRTVFFKLEDLVGNVESVQELLRFVGGTDIPVEKIKAIQSTPINELMIGVNEPSNMKKVLHFPHYTEWDDPTRERVRLYTHPLTELYQYSWL